MSEPLRLLLVSHSLSGGGAERFAANLLGALDRHLFAPEIALATPRITYPVPADVPVHSLGYGGLATLPRTIARLRRRIAAVRPGVVLSNVLSTACLTGAALTGAALTGAALKGDAPAPARSSPAWVARVGNSPDLAEPLLQSLWARRVYPRATFLVANSAGMLPALQRRYPAVAERCRFLPNPTDFARLDELAAAALPEAESHPGGGAAAGPRLLWVGRLTPQKRPDLLLTALALIRRALPQAPPRLMLCGDGPLGPRMRRLAHQLGVADGVEWLGFVANPFPLMRAADLFLLTSDFEGLPNALIEAQGLGLAAVATRCPHGPDEIVADGETGRLVPTGDADALAEATLALLGNPEARRRMGEAARARARALYDLPPLLARWEDLLLEAAGAGVARAGQGNRGS